MSACPDHWIRKMVDEQQMIEPFEKNQIKEVEGEKSGELRLVIIWI